MASTYRYAVKVRRGRVSDHLALAGRWLLICQGCGCDVLWSARGAAIRAATRHAANCEDLHRANWGAACPSCKLFGKVAKSCPECLGRGWVA